MSQDFELAFLIDRFVRQMDARIHVRASAFDTDKVGPFGGMVLMTIAELQPIGLTALGTRLARDKAQITRLIQRLETKGYVARVADEADGRAAQLSLSDKGEAFVQAIKAAVSAAADEVLNPLNEEERAQFMDMLRRV